MREELLVLQVHLDLLVNRELLENLDLLEIVDNLVYLDSKENPEKGACREMFQLLLDLLDLLEREVVMETMDCLDCQENQEKRETLVTKDHLELMEEMVKMESEVLKEILANLVLKVYRVDREEMVCLDPLDPQELWLRVRKFLDHQDLLEEMECLELLVLLA